MSVQGLKNIEAAIKVQQNVTEKGLRKGLFRAGLFLQRESQKIVPVETSILKNSAHTRMVGTGMDVAAIISYGTDYAMYVHENLEARHKPGKQAKFLEQPLRDHQERLREIIAQAIRETK